MSIVRLSKAALYGSVFSMPLAFAAHAADLIIYDPAPVAEQYVDLTLPAVSGPNGKIEFALGGITDPEAAIFRAGASFSMPLGNLFGIQADVGFDNTDGDWATGGALHLFMRDPSSYLLGVAAGVVVADGMTLSAIGPEAELYLDRMSLEAWAGWANVDYDIDAFDDDGFFAFGDIAYYVTDDWRISAGASTILGEGSLNLATEYQFAGLGFPLSATGEVRAYDDDRWSAKIGLKGYFGDEGKSLIDRHRQDDPRNRVLDLFAAAGSLEVDEPDEELTEQEECEARGVGWYWDTEAQECFSILT